MNISSIQMTPVTSKYFLQLIILFALLNLYACHPAHQVRPKQNMETVHAAVKEPNQNKKNIVPPTLPPADITQALLPSYPVSSHKKSTINTEPRFNVITDNVPAKAFFMSLVKDTPYNMVVHPGIKGNISLTLKNVTLNETMKMVRSVYGYEFMKITNGYEVLSNKLITRIFNINYLNINRSGNSKIQVSSGQVSKTTTTGSDTDTNNNNNETLASSSVSGSELNTSSDSDFWPELEQSLKTIIGEDKDKRVIVNPLSGIVMVHATPSEIRKIADFLEMTQSIIQRQVILEAKIIEVALNDGYQSGINWAALNSGGSITAAQVGGGTLLSSSTTPSIAGNNGILDPNNYTPIQGTTAAAFGGMFSLAVNFDRFNAFIELLGTQGDVHILSSPRISTINNQKAIIKVGSDEFFVTDIESRTTTTTAATQDQTVDVELTPFFSGVALDVIPQIDENGSIILHIHPTVSEVIEKTKQINITANNTMSVPLAFSSIRESDSIIRAQSGQIIAIGGLMKTSISSNDAGIPGLRSIPLIGNLFSHKKESTRKSELVILIRPIVVNNDYAWQKWIKKSYPLLHEK
ncbi:MAG: pilus (MSHA type) biogenesis protein MshL [Gammaproteobacteria bacterium]|nr:pilus (MSHA type) biogenesis protein MshL [Gammaproteobacteria bacterium]